MRMKKNIEKILRQYPDKFKDEEKHTADAKKRILELYGNNSVDAVQKPKRKFFVWYKILPIALSLAILISLPFILNNEPRFLEIGEVELNSYQSIQEYNELNNTNYIYFSLENAITEETTIATAKEDGAFAYLKQMQIVFMENDFDYLNFYASPSNVKCDEFDDYEIIKDKVEHKGRKYYVAESLVDETGRYLTLARFEYNNAKYYLKIESAQSGAFYTYIDLLFSN